MVAASMSDIEEDTQAMPYLVMACRVEGTEIQLLTFGPFKSQKEAKQFIDVTHMRHGGFASIQVGPMFDKNKTLARFS